MKAACADLKNQDKHREENDTKNGVTSTVKSALDKELILKTLNKHHGVDR